MWTFFKKENNNTTENLKEAPDNVYTVLNDELDRLHEQLVKLMANKSNAQTIWKRIELFQDAALEALKKQPTHGQEIRDLQDTVSEMLLLGNTTTETKDNT